MGRREEGGRGGEREQGGGRRGAPSEHPASSLKCGQNRELPTSASFYSRSKRQLSGVLWVSHHFSSSPQTP